MKVPMPFKRKLKYKGMYAIRTGEYSGGFIIYIKEHNMGDSLAFLSIPNPMESIYFDKNEINLWIKEGLLEFIESLPTDVYDVCKANFEYHKKKAL